MGTNTPRLNLFKPAPSDLVDVTTDISTNYDLIDAGTALVGHTHSGTYVDLTTAQTVAGIKTLTGEARFKGGVPWIDIRAYGAVADDSTDNTAAIQAAIDAAVANLNCGVVYVPAGSYRTGTLTISSSDLIFRGDSSGSSTNTARTLSKLKLKNGANASLFTLADGVASIAFSHLRLDGNSANQSGTSYGINIVDGAAAFDTWVSVEHCHIRDFLTDGIYSGVNRRALNITDSYVFSNGRHGINLKGSDNQLVRTLVGLNASTGVKIDTASVQRIVACDIFRNVIGIEAVGGAGITDISVLHSTTDRNGSQGMYFDVGAATIVQCYINANSVVTSGKSHVELHNSATNAYTLLANTFEYNASDFPSNQVAYDIFFSGTTGTVVANGNIHLAGSNNLGLSNNPNNLFFAAGADFRLRKDGQAEWGTAFDTNLYRSAADTLKTDDTLIIGTPGTAAGSAATINGTQTLTNKTISGASNTLSSIAESSVTNLTTDLAAKATLLDPLGFGIIRTVDPKENNAVGAFSGANRCIYSRVFNGGTITKIGLEVGTASGNISVAVYRNSGSGLAAVPSGSVVQSSGALACPSNGYQEVALGASVVVNPGDWLALTCDNTTATFVRAACSGTNLQKGTLFRQDTAHPAPSSVGTLAASAFSPVLLGVA